jgi:hypothetical protein
MILADAAELLDFSQPVAITLLAILHAIPDADDPHAIVAKLVSAVPAGSYLAVSHSVEEWRPDPAMANAGTSAVYGAVGRSEGRP